MRWDELSDNLETWTIRRDRMKAGAVHVVPLSPQARTVLAQISRGPGLTLPGARPGRPFSGWSKAKAELDKVAGIAGVGVARSPANGCDRATAPWRAARSNRGRIGACERQPRRASSACTSATIGRPRSARRSMPGAAMSRPWSMAPHPGQRPCAGGRQIMSEPDSVKTARCGAEGAGFETEAYFQGRRPVPGGFIDPATGRFPEDVERDFACGDIELHEALRLARHALAATTPRKFCSRINLAPTYERNGLIRARNYEVRV